MALPLRLILIFLIDFVLCERTVFVHPIVLIGKLISFLEKILRKIFGCTFEDKEKIPLQKRKIRERTAGFFLVLIVCAVCYGVPFVLLHILSRGHPVFQDFLSLWFCFRCVSARCLFDEAMNVHKKLGYSLDAGRAAVGRIVGRETSGLSEAGVARACVETVAENTTDGIFSPLFFYILGGAPLAFLYKAVNTMDSMIGYKNERYCFFGTVAARVDDVMNLIPARVCALCMILTQVFSPKRFARGARIFLRDRYKHESPNSAQTESVMAGILGVQLGGNAVYEGKVEEKPVLGDCVREIVRDDIKKSLRVMYGSCFVLEFFFALGFLVARLCG
ncbi:MAG: cobalamin biosynthesis protein CobD [Treponema sp.]|nr:cobalamin biosynthesis protein CobD [Treponema sp.]